MAINDNTSYELFGYQIKDLATKIKSKAEAASLAPVATSGLYADLTGKPTIPTVYNGTLTIQQNGTTVDTFTANSSADKTVNIETITAETVAPAEEVGAITASMINWSTMPGSYSATEQKTPFTWIDGKPIYKKTINVGSLPNATTKTVAHGVTSIGTVIDAKGSALRSTDYVWFLIPNTPNPLVGNVNVGIGITVSSSSIEISTGTDRTNMSGYVTLWYTKTTD